MTNRHQVKEIVEFLFLAQNILFLASQENCPIEKSFCQEHEKRRAEATAYVSLVLSAITALPSRC